MIISCVTENKEELLSLDFKEISIAFDFGDTIEIKKFKETITSIDNQSKFKIIGKFENVGDENEEINYDITEIDATNHICIKSFAKYTTSTNSMELFSSDTLENKVEIKNVQLQNQEYAIYKVVEEDIYTQMCNSSFFSPQFGFLLGKGVNTKLEMFQQNDNPIISQLIQEIKKDSLFMLCGIPLDLHKKRKHHHHHHH